MKCSNCGKNNLKEVRLNQLFYIEVLPIAFQVNGYSFLREEAKTILLPARGNESIFEFDDVMQLDIFMQRFNSK